MNSHPASRRAAYRLGFAGLIPFISLTLACWIAPVPLLGKLLSWQMSYGVAILAFLGGLHWGAALLCRALPIERSQIALWWGVTPSLLGVGAAWLPIGPGLALLCAAFFLLYLVDKYLYRWYGLPEWLPGLRLKLTCVVVPTLALTFAALRMRS
ncbi:MAG: DUF3429 domain-containing protein [Pseudomonadota bacterium]